MGFFAGLTGTEHPDRGTAPCPTEEARAALLALNGPEVPFGVRGGAPEGADLVAERRIADSARHAFFARTRVSRVTSRRRMRIGSACRTGRLPGGGVSVS